MHIRTHRDSQQDKEDIYAKGNKEIFTDKSRSKRGTHIILSEGNVHLLVSQGKKRYMGTGQ